MGYSSKESSSGGNSNTSYFMEYTMNPMISMDMIIPIIYSIFNPCYQ